MNTTESQAGLGLLLLAALVLVLVLDTFPRQWRSRAALLAGLAETIILLCFLL